jgi:hypothetical protein
MDKLTEYFKYAQGVGVDDKGLDWVNHTLKNYLEKNNPSQTEVEHVLDYLSRKQVKNLSLILMVPVITTTVKTLS